MQGRHAKIRHACCRLDIDVQLVTKEKGGFDDVRVRAALFQIDEGHPNGFLEVFPAVEVEVKDKDHWISLDANTKRSHAGAGTGGLALVRRSDSFRSSLTFVVLQRWDEMSDMDPPTRLAPVQPVLRAPEPVESCQSSQWGSCMQACLTDWSEHMHITSCKHAQMELCLQIDIDMEASAHLPALWSAEEPNVYVLVLSVVTKDGQHLDSESTQVMLSALCHLTPHN